MTTDECDRLMTLDFRPQCVIQHDAKGVLSTLWFEGAGARPPGGSWPMFWIVKGEPIKQSKELSGELITTKGKISHWS